MTQPPVPTADAMLRSTLGASPQARLADLERENAYLLQRNAQLQDDVTAIGAEAERLRQMLDRLHGRKAATPNPLSGGNSPA